jgi:hypothetical protein
MKTKKKPANARRPAKPEYKRHESAYGEDVPICTNAGCVLRKKAKCFGFEGCPGFKGK